MKGRGPSRVFGLIPMVTALALSACVDAAPVVVGDDNPGNPKAAAGLVDRSAALADYKTAADFAARAAADAATGQGGAMNDMADMPGMHHGMAPKSAGSQ